MDYREGKWQDGRRNNNAKQFTVVVDPQGIFSVSAVFGIMDIQFGLKDRVFVDGTSFNTSDGRLRVERGGLVYARNRARYPIAVPHI